jgi:selenium metabolism protein YedF
VKEIDARGLSCPAPVLQTKATLEEESPETIRVLLDNAASQQNVERFLSSQGFAVEPTVEGHDFVVTGSRNGSRSPAAVPTETPAPSTAAQTAENSIAVMCTTDRIGFGDDELGLKLMINFVRTLKEMGPELKRLILLNNGVKLAVEGSPVLPDLQELAQNGIKVLVCGTCLDHFNLLEQKQVGETTNMLDVVTSLQLVDKVINI